MLEVGPGPLAVLTELALAAGAARVLCVEAAPRAAQAAAERLQRPGEASGRGRNGREYEFLVCLRVL